MTGGEGFTDLRLNRQEGQTEESFWPSFTDIMTVIVMIFLLAMVILLVRNMELVEQLRATMKAEREAAALAQSTGAEKDSLRHQLQASELQAARLREQVLRMAGQSEQQEAAIASQRHQIDALLTEQDRLSLDLEREQGRGQQLGEELVQAQTRLDAERGRLAESLNDLETTRAALDEASRRHATTVKDLETARTALDEERRRLAESLQALDASRAALAESNALAVTRAGELADTRRTLAGVEGERERIEALLEQRIRELAEARGALATLEATHAELGARQTRVEQEVKSLLVRQQEQNAHLDREQQESDALAKKLAQAQAEETAARAELDDLRLRHRIQEQALTQALARIQAADLDLSRVKESYGDLRIKYDELVKPARTAEGRFLVEIRYYKAQGALKIELRESGGPGFAPVTRERLEARLAEMKKQHPEGLYVRVIFPDDSGLSYKEAWGFTTELHRKFDYYYKDRQGAALPAPEVEPPTDPIAQ